MAARRPFWKLHRWKSIGFCLWPPSTCIWNLKLKFQSKLDLCSGNHVVYRQTDRRTDKVNPVYPPSNFVGRGYNNFQLLKSLSNSLQLRSVLKCFIVDKSALIQTTMSWLGNKPITGPMMTKIYHTIWHQWPLLLTWINFNPSMDK